MPRYDDRYDTKRLYVGRLSSRTRSRDLEHIFSKYGRVRNVDLKYDYAFVEFSDSRDADDARYNLNGREVDGSRLLVEFAKGVPRGPGGSREYMGRGPTPGSGRCFNCGIDGHWARDCKAGDWKNTCYRCGERGHIERNCHNSPKKLSRRGRSHSRSPVRSRSPYRGRGRDRSYGRSPSYSQSRSPPKRERIVERKKKRSRSLPRYSRSPEPETSPRPSKARKLSPTPEKGSPSPSTRRAKSVTEQDGSDYSGSPRARSTGPVSPKRYESPRGANGRGRSTSPRDDINPVDDDDVGNYGSPRGSVSP